MLLFAMPPLSAAINPVTLHTASAESFKAHVAGPAKPVGAIVLVHDWFGVSPFYEAATERLAGMGYLVVAVDLYGGRRATTHEEAAALLGSVQDDLASRELDAAVRWAAQRSGQVALMAFSMGVKHALAAATRNDSVAASVLWYGETTADPEKLHHLRGPVLLVVGSKDGPSAAENALRFSQAADAAGRGAEVYVYPGAAHAFAQPLFNEGRTFDPVAAETAWRLSEDFLKRRLTQRSPE
jgi:carboxymethylenebutenolidase